jgi:hypothetical protein
MSTGNMPNPPDMPTSQTPPGDPQAQTAATSAATTSGDSPPASSAPTFNPAEDIAGIIERDADILAQRLLYHSQTMYGVGAVGVDIVNARNAAMVLANALRNSATMQAEDSLFGIGEPQIVQINDGTLPFKNNAQVAGLFEGLVLETLSRAYADNPARLQLARALLGGIFQPANERMQQINRLMTNIPSAKALGPGMPSAS